MAICYVFNLLQHQINPVIHSLAHSFENKISVIAHQTISAGEFDSHHLGEHVVMNNTHEHELIELIESILDSNDSDGGTEESLLVQSKVDKHISLTAIDSHFSSRIQETSTYWSTLRKCKKGYLLESEEPPKAS